MHSCRVCGAISTTKNCPKHTAEKLSTARATGKLRRAVIQRDHGTCQLCGEPVRPGTEHIDHIVARANAGTTTLGNLQLTHSWCNKGKDTT